MVISRSCSDLPSPAEAGFAKAGAIAHPKHPALFSTRVKLETVMPRKGGTFGADPAYNHWRGDLAASETQAMEVRT
jgi:hypothetical protein